MHGNKTLVPKRESQRHSQHIEWHNQLLSSFYKSLEFRLKGKLVKEQGNIPDLKYQVKWNFDIGYETGSEIWKRQATLHVKMSYTTVKT